MPYGVIGFYGEALNIQDVTESDIVQTVTLPIARTSGNLGDVQVGNYYQQCTYGSRLQVQTSVFTYRCFMK